MPVSLSPPTSVIRALYCFFQQNPPVPELPSAPEGYMVIPTHYHVPEPWITLGCTRFVKGFPPAHATTYAVLPYWQMDLPPELPEERLKELATRTFATSTYDVVHNVLHADLHPCRMVLPDELEPAILAFEQLLRARGWDTKLTYGTAPLVALPNE